MRTMKFSPYFHAPLESNSNMSTSYLPRRTFLKLAVGTGSGLILGVYSPLLSSADALTAFSVDTLSFNPFVKIAPDNKVIVVCKHMEMGQGTATGLATLVAEELDAEWAQMDIEFAPANLGLYKNLFFGTQGTGGSTAMANSFEQYRTAGAAARAMLVKAAAEKWNVAPRKISLSKGVLSDGVNTATFGELVNAAAELSPPENVRLKEPEDFVYIGKAAPRLDQKSKSTAQPIFTQDMLLPDMLIAVVARPPRFKAKVLKFDPAKSKAVKDVVAVVEIPQGIAVVATSTWAALKGREALEVTWEEKDAERRSTSELLEEYRALANTSGIPVVKKGDASAALRDAPKTIEAEFVFPFLAHATLEPMNAIVQFKDNQCTIWNASQMQTIDQVVAAAILGIRPEDVTINTLMAGGSFGRRAVYNAEYVAEAAQIVKALATSQPVKLLWTREDDIKGGYYRPMYVHKVKVGITVEGAIVGWQHRIVGQSIIEGTALQTVMMKDGVDATTVEGINNIPYTIENFDLEVHNTKFGAPPLWWRSVGHTHTAYVVETLIDEIAKLCAKDPVSYRLDLLKNHPRHVAVLKLAAEKAGWGSPPDAHTGRGIAVHESFKSFVAQVAEVRIVDGKVKVERVVCAVDCGLSINPDNIVAQMEGGIGFGLGAILHSEITFTDGLVDQSNFNDYKVLRFDEMPRVEVYIVPSTQSPTGVGEPGTPPIGPAVANAVAAMTGRRIRVLPLDKTKLALS